MYRFSENDAQPLTDSRLANQYDLNIAVLGGLGFGDREIETDVPPFEVIRDALSDADRQWISQQTALGYAARLTIAPSIQAIGLEGDRDAPGLIPRFDLKQVRKGDTRVSKDWRAIGDKSAAHDNGFDELFSAAILLTPTEPISLIDASNGKATPEQILRSISSVPDKIKALEDQRAEQAQQGRRIVSAPISHLVISEAQDRHAGQRSFHHRQASCQVHYPPLAGYKGDTRPTLSRSGRHKQRLELNARALFVANEVVLRTLHIPTSAD